MRLLGAAEVDGELELTVETTAVRVGCPGCGVVAVLHARRETVVRDVAGLGRAVRLRWRKRVRRCEERLCATRTWTERHAAVAPRATLSERARLQAAERVAKGESVLAVARELGVGWATVMRAFAEHGHRWLAEAEQQLPPTRVLGLDETVWQRARRGRHTQYATGFVDGDSGRLLDLVEGRSTVAAAGWIAAQDPAWREQVAVAAVDPFEATPARSASSCPTRSWWWTASTRCGWATAWSMTSAAVCSKPPSGTAAAARTRCTGARRRLASAADRLDDRGWQRLEAAFTDGDPDHEVYNAWTG
jgi:transposase